VVPVKLQLRRSTVAISMLCMLATASWLGSIASAAGAGSPGLRPGDHFPNGYFEYNAQPGQVIQATLVITDLGDAPGRFLVYACDGLTSPYSGIVYANRDQPLVDGPSGNGEYGAGSWISVSGAPISLAPGQQTTLRFTIAVPKDAAAGDYVGAIAAENPETTVDSSGQFSLGVTQRTVEAVVVHIPNPADTAGVHVGKPSISTENHKRQLLNIPIDYRADVLGKPLLDFTVTDTQKQRLVHFSDQLDTFVPHSSIVYVYPLDKVVLGPATYCFDGNFGLKDHEQHFSYCFDVTPAQGNVPRTGKRDSQPPAVASSPAWRSLVIGGAGLLAVLVLLGILLLRRQRCAHCSKRQLGALIKVDDAGDVRGCASCSAQLRRVNKLALCRSCYRLHLRESPPEPPRAPRLRETRGPA
jgi:hypothetical protein